MSRTAIIVIATPICVGLLATGVWPIALIVGAAAVI